jgi:type I restriction enzyme R subunit
VIDKKILAEPPFTDINDQGIFGLFDSDDQDRILSIIDEINNNAIA